jgi:hypothetical protein
MSARGSGEPRQAHCRAPTSAADPREAAVQEGAMSTGQVQQLKARGVELGPAGARNSEGEENDSINTRTREGRTTRERRAARGGGFRGFRK